MPLTYNKVNISVDGLRILADSVNINQSSPQKAIYSLNNKNPYDNVPTTVKNSIAINYFLEPGNEPNYITLFNIINDTSIPIKSVINIGEIFITGYLNNYSLKLSPNSLISAAASFDIFYDFTGSLSPQGVADSSLYDLKNSSGIAHYWSAQFISGSNVVSDNYVLQLDYGANITNTPIYSIGSPYPIQIYINNIIENLNVVSELQQNIKFSGQLLNDIIPSLQILRLKNISSTYSDSIIDYINFPLTGMVLQDCQTNIATDGTILFSNTYTKSH